MLGHLKFKMAVIYRKGARWPNTWKMCYLSTFLNPIFRSFTWFSFIKILFNFERILVLRPSRNVMRTRHEMLWEGTSETRRTVRSLEGQELNNRICSHKSRFGDNNTDFHVASTPKSAMSLGIRETLAALVVRRAKEGWPCHVRRHLLHIRRSRQVPSQSYRWFI